ncbi:MAG: glutamate--tRNA ligase, partial [Chitinophagaceae bacterium]
EGAEQYIFDCLRWAGLEPDESTEQGGQFGPYRQSERKEIYHQYAEQLIRDGHAYYAFDTPEELEQMRQDLKSTDNPSPQYDKKVRHSMRNSISLSAGETKKLIDEDTQYVVRIKIPDNETVSFIDLIRNEVRFDTSVLDDKVLMKADGMPTYHLAVVVDDYLMKITHAFRGEEWLPSAPVHVLLWKYLFGIDNMPQWAHLPLILGPNGKLSKRDGAKFGFPVFAMNWTDPKTNEVTEGFKERGFLPEAFINLLALLGWNDGSEKEIYSKEELIQAFSIERVHSGGARFDYEKARWFNHEWIKRLDIPELRIHVKNLFAEKRIHVTDEILLDKAIELVKDRCTLITDFYDQCYFLFQSPVDIDTSAIQSKWEEKKNLFFIELIRVYKLSSLWQRGGLETAFTELAAANQLKPGELMLPFRIMLVGGKFGPGVFDIAEILGKKETIERIKKVLAIL